MALELGPHNIRVNNVGPTVVMTEMGKLGWSDPQKAQSMISKIPLGRFAGTINSIYRVHETLVTAHGGVLEKQQGKRAVAQCPLPRRWQQMFGKLGLERLGRFSWRVLISTISKINISIIIANIIKWYGTFMFISILSTFL